MVLFHIEPPKSNDVGAWEAWLEADKKAETAAKRKATCESEHGDASELWGHLSLGFEGDFSEGTGELVPVVQASQDSALLSKRARGTSKRRLSGAQRRKLKKQRR